MAKKVSMSAWIRECMTDSDKDGSLSMLALVYMVAGGMQQREIHTTKFAAGKSWSPDDLERMFQGKADTYTQDMPGTHDFQLMAFYGGRDTPQSYFPFRRVTQHDTDATGMMTEPPTPEGRMRQGMRWQDMQLSQVYERQRQLDSYSLSVISHQQQQITSLMRENRDAFEIVKDVLMKQALDSHGRQMEQLKFERASAERSKWITFLPALVNTVLGREVFPQATEDTALVESIADSLTEEDIMKLATTIKPELMGPLAARMQKYLVKKQAEEHARKQMAQYATPDPEAEAAGEVALSNVTRIK